MPTIYVHFADGMKEEMRGREGGGDCVGLVVLSRCDLFHMKMRKANRKLAG